MQYSLKPVWSARCLMHVVAARRFFLMGFRKGPFMHGKFCWCKPIVLTKARGTPLLFPDIINLQFWISIYIVHCGWMRSLIQLLASTIIKTATEASMCMSKDFTYLT